MAGNLSLETCWRVLENNGASCNYAIDSNGQIGLFVDEGDRSWCSSSPSNDNQAVTIEVANSGGGPNWPVSNKALAALINLCEDICRRNGISELTYTGDTSGNVTHHYMFTATACPGPYLKDKTPYVVETVNARLARSTPEAPANLSDVSGSAVLYRVQVGAFVKKEGADKEAARLKAMGYQVYMVKAGGLYKIQTGAFASKSSAARLAEVLKSKGFSVYITTKAGTAVSSAATPKPLQIGDKVRVKQGALDWDGDELLDFVYKSVFELMELDGNRAVFGIGGSVTAAIDVGRLYRA